MNRAPVIWANKTKLLVDEGLPPGALVGAMAADDLDEGENNEISGNVEFFMMDNSGETKEHTLRCSSLY